MVNYDKKIQTILESYGNDQTTEMQLVIDVLESGYDFDNVRDLLEHVYKNEKYSEGNPVYHESYCDSLDYNQLEYIIKLINK